MTQLTYSQTKNDAILFQFIAFLMGITTIFATREISPTWAGRMQYVMFPLIFVWFHFMRNYTLRPVAIIYCLALLLGFLFHNISGSTEKEADFRAILFTRYLTVYVLAMFFYLQRPIRFIQIFVLLFFIAECAISIYERVEMTHVISYSNDLLEGFLDVTSSQEFRSFSLMFHPLYNANTVSIGMAFVLCARGWKFIYKLLFFALGLAALWGFNSRGAFLVWAVILLFRCTLYNARWWKILIAVIILYFGIPILFDWLLVSGLLGRLEGLDFSDASTGTRLIALDVFLNQRWNLEDILFGGRMITYSGVKTTLENGVLLDLGYWGLIIGPVKIICEVLISYYALRYYALRDKVIILLATWGVAFMNNNSFNTWPLAMFALFCITFTSPYQPEHAEGEPAES